MGAIALSSGCESEEAVREEMLATTAALQGPGAPVVLRPEGVYFAEVTADGAGCRPGSWTSSISGDGQVFTMVFSEYELNLAPTDSFVTKDCNISMRLRSESELSFAVMSIYYTGFAYLEDGVRARQTVRYGFHGTSADAGNSRKDFEGPLDEGFLIEDDLGADRQKWSPCGTDHTLTASTELRMQNGTPRANGYMNLSAADATVKLELKLGWRGCGNNGNSGRQVDDAGAPGNRPTPAEENPGSRGGRSDPQQDAGRGRAR